MKKDVDLSVVARDKVLKQSQACLQRTCNDEKKPQSSSGGFS